MLGYRQRKVIIDSLLDFASYAFYYINIEVTYELLILEIIADNPSVDFGMPGELFEVKQATLSEHINNIISSGELDETSIGFSDKSSGRRKPKIGCDYAYDCRVKTRRKRYNGESCNEFFDNVVSS